MNKLLLSALLLIGSFHPMIADDSDAYKDAWKVENQIQQAKRDAWKQEQARQDAARQEYNRQRARDDAARQDYYRR